MKANPGAAPTSVATQACQFFEMPKEITIAPRSCYLSLNLPSNAESFCSAARDAVANGFGGIEIVLPNDCEFQQGGLDRLVATIDLIRSAGGAGPLAVSAACRVGSHKVSLARLQELMEATRASGVENLNLRIERDGRDPSGGYGDTLNQVYQLLKSARFDAQRCGVSVSLEAGGSGFPSSPAELRDLIDELCAWPFGGCVDLTNHSSPGDHTDWLLTLGRRVHFVRWGCPSEDGGISHPPTLPTSLENVLNEIQFEGSILCPSGDIQDRWD